MSKQTSTEWLYEQLTSTWFDKTSGQHILEQAKEIEKEQMIDFAFDTYCYISGIMKVPFNQVSENKSHVEDNYNDTYGGKDGK
jgi:hypothetical protein